MDKFYESNLEIKHRFMQNEHIFVLNCIYANALKIEYIVNGKINKTITQVMGFEEIHKELSKEIDKNVLFICLNDLEHLGFIFKSHDAPGKEIKYSITNLGVEYCTFYKND